MSHPFNLATVLLALATTFASFGATAQSYPNKPIRWVVGYPAGGGTDFLARTTGAQLSQQLGQPIVVENRPGASAIIAAESVARARADGYTVLSADNGMLVYNSALYKKLNYEPQRDFALLGMMGRSPLIIAAAPATDLKSAKALIAALRATPGKYSIATVGVGSPHHLAMELFQRETGLSMLHVPYKGGAQALQDLMGGQVPLMMMDLPSGIGAIQAGKVVPLLAMSAERIPQLPNVPTAKELGYPNVVADTWQGLAVPAGTPQNVQELLSKQLQLAVRDPGLRQKLYQAGWQAEPSNADDMRSYVRAEREKWHALIKSLNISLD